MGQGHTASEQCGHSGKLGSGALGVSELLGLAEFSWLREKPRLGFHSKHFQPVALTHRHGHSHAH